LEGLDRRDQVMIGHMENVQVLYIGGPQEPQVEPQWGRSRNAASIRKTGSNRGVGGYLARKSTGRCPRRAIASISAGSPPRAKLGIDPAFLTGGVGDAEGGGSYDPPGHDCPANHFGRDRWDRAGCRVRSSGSSRSDKIARSTRDPRRRPALSLDLRASLPARLRQVPLRQGLQILS
jgi:hypothetical protein